MTRTLWRALAAFCLLTAAAAAQTGYVTMTGSGLTDSSGALIGNATACWQPVGSTGLPFSPQINGAGHASQRAVCGPVNNGALVGTWQPSDPTAAATNLVPDPVIATGWTTWTNGGTGWSIVSGAGESGNNAIEVSSAAASNGNSATAAITVAPGQTYAFSGYLDATAVTANSPEWVVENYATGAILAAAPQTHGVAGTVYAQFTVPAGVSQVKVVAANLNATLSSGAIKFSAPLLQAGALQLADTSRTQPLNLCYQLTITSNVDGSTLLGGSGSPYSCVQPAWNTTSPNTWCQSGLCNFDQYPPSGTSAASLTVGPVVSVGTVSTGSPGSSASASIVPNPVAPYYSLNLTIPQGSPGIGSDSHCGADGSGNLNCLTAKIGTAPWGGTTSVYVQPWMVTMTPQAFGAQADDSTDDGAALQACFNFASNSGGTCNLKGPVTGSGTTTIYKSVGQLSIPTAADIEGPGDNIVWIDSRYNGFAMAFNESSATNQHGTLRGFTVTNLDSSETTNEPMFAGIQAVPNQTNASIGGLTYEHIVDVSVRNTIGPCEQLFGSAEDFQHPQQMIRSENFRCWPLEISHVVTPTTFTVTAVATVSGFSKYAVYTIASNAKAANNGVVGERVAVSGCTSSGNNSSTPFTIINSTATSLTLINPSRVAESESGCSAVSQADNVPAGLDLRAQVQSNKWVGGTIYGPTYGDTNLPWLIYAGPLDPTNNITPQELTFDQFVPQYAQIAFECNQAQSIQFINSDMEGLLQPFDLHFCSNILIAHNRLANSGAGYGTSPVYGGIVQANSSTFVYDNNILSNGTYSLYQNTVAFCTNATSADFRGSLAGAITSNCAQNQIPVAATLTLTADSYRVVGDGSTSVTTITPNTATGKFITLTAVTNSFYVATGGNILMGTLTSPQLVSVGDTALFRVLDYGSYHMQLISISNPLDNISLTPYAKLAVSNTWTASQNFPTGTEVNGNLLCDSTGANCPSAASLHGVFTMTIPAVSSSGTRYNWMQVPPGGGTIQAAMEYPTTFTGCTTTNPTIEVEDCGTTLGSCASPTVLLTVTPTAGTAPASYTINSATLTAGHWIVRLVSAIGSCTSYAGVTNITW